MSAESEVRPIDEGSPLKREGETNDEGAPLTEASGAKLAGRSTDNKRASFATAFRSRIFLLVTMVFIVAGIAHIIRTRFLVPKKTRIAFVGNSMQYYNDLPRFLETLSGGDMEQSSCLHGGTSLSKILVNGNGMFSKFDTPNALLESDFYGSQIYDFGACTVPQLFFGHDPDLELQVHWKSGYLQDDGRNPCLQNGRYFDYLEQTSLHKSSPPRWDFVFFNDNTANPGRNRTRQEGLAVLESVYLPWIRRLGATPVFLDTHAYYTETRDLRGLAESEEDMPLFTSLTYEGYKQYARLLQNNLPVGQTPRIAPVGVSFLMVWEEDRELWHKLFHSDHLHASPLGTFLTGCVVHHTLFGTLPAPEKCLIPDMPSLWARARVMQDKKDPPNPFPTRQEAEYLYRICERVAAQGERPSSFLLYQNGEAAADDFVW